MIQLAWRFLMFQKDSALAQWFRARTEKGHTAARRLPDDIPPLPHALARRPMPGGYVIRDASGQALA